MMRQTILLMSLFICVFFSVNAQISTDEEPVSFREGNIPSRFSVSQDIRIMPALDMNRIEQEDAKDEANGLPPRFGYPHEVSLDLENSGHWQELSNGDRLWQLTIRCPQALSINLLYDRFWLPEGGKFFIYTADRKHSIGAFTSINNKGGRDNVQGFATGLLYGDEVTLEYYQPKQVTEQAIISVSSVIHGYKYVRIASDKKLTNSNSPVPPGFCFVEISCPEGRDWQKEKNAIAMIVKGERAIGTGALINNTKNNGEPLFLTANHCLDNKYDARGNRAITDWLFYWRYEDPNCKYVSAIKPKFSTSGAEVIANNPGSDFALLRLTEDPSRIVGVTPYYLGWDRSGNPGGQGASIHHPFGSTMKISIVKDRPLEVDYKPENNHVARCWKVNWSKGMIEQATQNAQKFGAKVNFQLLDAQQLPFEDDTFDVIVTRNVKWNLPHPKAAYKEWKRVLKKGGKMINFDSNWYSYLFDENLHKYHDEHPDKKLQEVLPDGMEARMENIAKTLPLSKERRPAWDVNCLLDLGFSKMAFDYNINDEVYDKEHQEINAYAPMFRIIAVK